MTRNRRRFAVCAAVVTALTLGITAVPAQAEEPEPYQVLVVGKTLGFRHSSIDETTNAIIEIGAANGFTVDVWDNRQPTLTLPSTPFTSGADLAKYATVIFVSTVDGTNNLDPNRPTILNAAEQVAYEDYIEAGGGFVGIHAATDSMHTVPWYGGLIGGNGYFRNHPSQQTATLVVEDPTHPSTNFMPATWDLFEEWYNYTNNPREVVRVLMTLDESSYNPGSGAMGEDHPIVWCHNYDGGRSWQTGLGHRETTVARADFRQHILGGIEWTAGVTSGGGDCVTFYEVETLLDESTSAGGARLEQADRELTKRLGRAEEAADAGDHSTAVRELQIAEVVAENMLDDSVVAGKIGDLIEWQSGLG